VNLLHSCTGGRSYVLMPIRICICIAAQPSPHVLCRGRSQAPSSCVAGGSQEASLTEDPHCGSDRSYLHHTIFPLRCALITLMSAHSQGMVRHPDRAARRVCGGRAAELVRSSPRPTADITTTPPSHPSHLHCRLSTITRPSASGCVDAMPKFPRACVIASGHHSGPATIHNRRPEFLQSENIVAAVPNKAHPSRDGTHARNLT
jgi:hypothetical protein